MKRRNEPVVRKEPKLRQQEYTARNGPETLTKTRLWPKKSQPVGRDHNNSETGANRWNGTIALARRRILQKRANLSRQGLRKMRNRGKPLERNSETLTKEENLAKDDNKSKGLDKLGKQEQL